MMDKRIEVWQFPSQQSDGRSVADEPGVRAARGGRRREVGGGGEGADKSFSVL